MNSRALNFGFVQKPHNNKRIGNKTCGTIIRLYEDPTGDFKCPSFDVLRQETKEEIKNEENMAKLDQQNLVEANDLTQLEPALKEDDDGVLEQLEIPEDLPEDQLTEAEIP
jgi:hypothetical protein